MKSALEHARNDISARKPKQSAREQRARVMHNAVTTSLQPTSYFTYFIGNIPSEDFRQGRSQNLYSGGPSESQGGRSQL